ncbi:MAG: HD domain-containing protein [Candidatus Thorarchaeota archaeon]
MNPEIENQLRQMVTNSTRKAAVDEWKKSASKQRLPLYNYRGDHVEQVVRLVKEIGPTTDVDMDIVILAAWLHDLAKPGIEGIEIRHHGIASAELAEDWLAQAGYDAKTITQVADAVRKHVGLKLDKSLEPIEAQVLWEADKILKLGIIGLLQYVLNGIRITPGQNLHEIAKKLRNFLPLAEDIAGSVVTEKGKEIAAERLKNLYQLVDMLDSELIPRNP